MSNDIVSKPRLIAIVGTNASGKSGLGVELALKYNGEIVSADSRQVFKGLDLGSGKITPAEMKGIKHHLLDVAMPNDFFGTGTFQKLAYKAIDDITGRNLLPFMVGGTGLYVNSIIDGYTFSKETVSEELRTKVNSMTSEELILIIKKEAPEFMNTIDLSNKRRLERACERILSGQSLQVSNNPKYETLTIGVTWPRDVLYQRIKERLDRRLKDGMIDEVISLRKAGASDDFLYKLGLEYRYILMYLRNEFESFDAFYDKLFTEIRHLAKEQMTWFRKRSDINWIDMSHNPIDSASALIDSFLA